MLRQFDIQLQAEAFLDWHRKRGQPLEHDFAFWSRSKSFGLRDRRRIWWAVRELATSVDSTLTLADWFRIRRPLALHGRLTLDEREVCDG